MSEKYQQQIIEALDAKKRQWITKHLKHLIEEYSVELTHAEFQQIVENSLQFMNEQQEKGTIVVNKITLGL